jgi:tRNA A37 threonylcarbamoyladenosine synthetase subunit TsaC/SUA5/YrdC
VAVYLDAGEVPIGLASTIVDLTSEVPVVRREGAVSIEALRDVLDTVELAS